MLERAAVTLETCNLYKALSPPTVSRKPCNQLNSAFWVHWGLSDICQADTTGPDPIRNDSKVGVVSQTRENGTPPMAASAFFAYPRRAATLLQHIPRCLGARYEPRQPRRMGVASPFHAISPGRLQFTAAADLHKSGPDPQRSESIAARSAVSSGSSTQSQQDHLIDATKLHQQQPTTALNDIMPKDGLDENDHIKSSDHAWKTYTSLDPASRGQLAIPTLEHLAKSDRAIDAWKIIELFDDVASADWTETIIITVIKAHLTLSNTSSAVIIFKRALDVKECVQGLDILLAYAFQSSRWTMALELWQVFQSKFSILTHSIEFRAVASVPQLADKISQLYEFAESSSKAGYGQNLRTRVDALARYLFTAALIKLVPEDALRILEHLKDSDSYEKLIQICVEHDRKSVAMQAYRQYRALPSVQVRVPVLRCMLSVFFPRDKIGIEEVLHDWYRCYGYLDAFAYRKFLAFYAGRGNVQTVSRLFKEYKQRFRDAVYDSSALTSVMQVHAVRGEVEKVQKIFDKVIQVYDRQQKSIFWNILLNAHAKAGDYDGAFRCFTLLNDISEPDAHSFGTMMGMVGSKGDLQCCIEMYEMAKKSGTMPSITMMDALVEAYCQNDRFDEAENLCKKISNRDGDKSRSTVLWNTLLHHYAHRRDLTNINRLLEIMTGNDVPYNDQTYEQLLLALFHCRQSHHALHMLRTARENNIFQPTLNHYIMLMALFIRTKEPYMALRVDEMLTEMEFPQSTDRTTKLIAALGQWQRIPLPARRGNGADHYLELLVEAFFESESQREIGVVSDQSRSVTGQFTETIFVLTQMREFANIPRLAQLYNKRFGRNTNELPISLLKSFMLADFYENNFSRLKSTWEVVLQSAKQFIRSPLNEKSQQRTDENNLVPARRYILSDPLKTMQRLFLAESDSQGLLELIARVQAEGFELDSKNWNYHVQALARLQRTREAFLVCEEILMPMWTGWALAQPEPGRLSRSPRPALELRRLGSSPRHNRPTSYTLLILAREYVNLEQTAIWSHDAARLFNKINDSAARVVQAIRTMVPLGYGIERELFDDPTSSRSDFTSMGDNARDGESSHGPLSPSTVQDKEWSGIESFPDAAASRQMSRQAGRKLNLEMSEALFNEMLGKS